MLLKSNKMRGLLAAVVLCAQTQALPAAAIQDSFFTPIQVGRYEREYLLYRRDKSAPKPLIIVLHGEYGAIRGARKLGFEELADENGFAVVYPRGTNKQWMDGRHNDFTLNNRGLDDIAFLRALTDKLIADKVADPERIYVVGFSGGGIMAYRAACEMTGTFAAVASVAASMARGYEYLCRPSRPIPLMIINGTADPVTPWKGGTVSMVGSNVSSGEIISVDKNVAFWRRENKCADSSHLEAIDTDPSLSPVFHHRWDKCDVELYEIRDGDHSWPGQKSPLIAPIMFHMGNTAPLDATKVIWEFFKSKARAPGK
jgi:polyhydroxybutyrate depolymerase